MTTSTYAQIEIDDPDDLRFNCLPDGKDGMVVIELGPFNDPVGHIRASRAAAEALAKGIAPALTDLDAMIADVARWNTPIEL